MCVRLCSDTRIPILSLYTGLKCENNISLHVNKIARNFAVNRSSIRERESLLTVRVARCKCKGQEQGECRNKHGDCRVTEAVAGKRLTEPDDDFYSGAFSCILLDISAHGAEWLSCTFVCHSWSCRQGQERKKWGFGGVPFSRYYISDFVIIFLSVTK